MGELRLVLALYLEGDTDNEFLGGIIERTPKERIFPKHKLPQYVHVVTKDAKTIDKKEKKNIKEREEIVPAGAIK